jgi:hypothetical protein
MPGFHRATRLQAKLPPHRFEATHKPTGENFMKRLISIASLVLIASLSQPANAAITVYTSQAAFLAAVSNPATDTFLGLVPMSFNTSPITRTTGTYAYTAATSASDEFVPGGTPSDPFLSTNLANSFMNLSNFSSGVSALGGNFFASDIYGHYLNGPITVLAADQSSNISQTISPPSINSGSFLGFVSTETMVSLRIISTDNSTNNALWPSVDNLILAGKGQPVLTPAIPEPETYALMLACLGVLVGSSNFTKARKPLVSQ